MTYRSRKDMENNKKSHGGYRKLKSYQTTTFIYDLTIEFCNRHIDSRSRTKDQMVQAARSGRQNIAEGSLASGISKKTEIKLVGVARASLEELLLDYQDFLRQRGLALWDKDSPQAQEVRSLSYKTNRTYETYKSYTEKPETFANCVICLIHQANFLLDRQIASLEEEFVEKGGYTEKLFRKRLEARNRV